MTLAEEPGAADDECVGPLPWLWIQAESDANGCVQE